MIFKSLLTSYQKMMLWVIFIFNITVPWLFIIYSFHLDYYKGVETVVWSEDLLAEISKNFSLLFFGLRNSFGGAQYSSLLIDNIYLVVSIFFFCYILIPFFISNERFFYSFSTLLFPFLFSFIFTLFGGFGIFVEFSQLVSFLKNFFFAFNFNSWFSSIIYSFFVLNSSENNSSSENNKMDLAI